MPLVKRKDIGTTNNHNAEQWW